MSFSMGTPVWETRAEALAILNQYRRWYGEDLSDKAISALIREVYTLPHNPPRPKDWRKYRSKPLREDDE